jgi:hypothetical protein
MPVRNVASEAGRCKGGSSPQYSVRMNVPHPCEAMGGVERASASSGAGRTRRVGNAGLSALAVGWPPSAVAFAFTILFHVRLRRPQTPFK